MRIKNLISFLMIIGVVAIGSQAVSAQFNRPIPRQNDSSQCDRSQLSPIKCGFYEEGYLDGAADARNNLKSNYRKYRGKYSNQYESFYRDGYENGYRGLNSGTRWTMQQRAAYDLGYNYGSNDENRRVSRFPDRYNGRYNRNYQSYYEKGYFDGYDQKSRQYDTTIGGVDNPRFPSSGNRPRGTATGTLTWNGRVDNRVQISLRADEVKTTAIAGRLSGVFHNLNGVLPRNATISVRTLDGRGQVRVLQQPSRANRNTAIVEIYDSKRSDDNYSLEISWVASRVQETYEPGKLTWRGIVDGTVDISISGDFAEAFDKTGSGLRVIESDLEGYLAGRNASVRVNKKEGRGTVSVIEQPSQQNDYTAVIRIFDPKGGDDEYELEVIW